MVILNFLRALADLGIYYSVAGMLASYFGAQLVLVALFLQSACFAFSFSLRRSKTARVMVLVPALLLLLLASSLADVFVYIPPLTYLIYLVWKDRYQLSWERQKTLFTVSARVFTPIACLFAILKFQALLTVGVPSALLAALASVLLLRSLRHDAEVYLQPKYQLMNFIGIVALIPVALLLGSEWSVAVARFLVVTLYEDVIVPLLTGIGMLIGFVFIGIPAITAFLRRLLWSESDEGIPPDPLEGEEETLTHISSAALSEQVIQIATVVFVLIAVVALLRWMLRRSQEETLENLGVRRDLPSDTVSSRSVLWARTYANRIRKQYRIFLQMCQRKGVSIQPTDTSTDIAKKSLVTFSDATSLESLRDIYQKARYQGATSRADYQEFKRLLGTLKKPPNRGI